MSSRYDRRPVPHRGPPPALDLEAVSKVYQVGGIEITALDDVDLTVTNEEVVILLGPSGSGKTTLLSIAGGLLSPTSGRVHVGGVDISNASSRRRTKFRRQHVGFIFQGVNLVPFLTARENLLIAAELARRDRSAAKKRADLLLEELGLGHRAKNLPGQLSGGERQRVGIARALMNAPGLILVDEPTSALDSHLGEQVMELIVSKAKSRGAAAVIVTHDQRMARYGDRILNMADGRIASVTPRPEWTGQAAPPVVALPSADPYPATGGGWPAALASGDPRGPLELNGGEPRRPLQLEGHQASAASMDLSLDPAMEQVADSVFGPVTDPGQGSDRVWPSDWWVTPPEGHPEAAGPGGRRGWQQPPWSQQTQEASSWPPDHGPGPPSSNGGSAELPQRQPQPWSPRRSLGPGSEPPSSNGRSAEPPQRRGRPPVPRTSFTPPAREPAASNGHWTGQRPATPPARGPAASNGHWTGQRPAAPVARGPRRTGQSPAAQPPAGQPAPSRRSAQQPTSAELRSGRAGGARGPGGRRQPPGQSRRSSLAQPTSAELRSGRAGGTGRPARRPPPDEDGRGRPAGAGGGRPDPRRDRRRDPDR